MSSVFVTNIDDYISPSQACIVVPLSSSSQSSKQQSEERITGRKGKKEGEEVSSSSSLKKGFKPVIIDTSSSEYEEGVTRISGLLPSSSAPSIIRPKLTR